MPYITSAETARSERKAIDVLGQTYHLSPYVGNAPTRGQYIPGNEKNDNGLPQGFLVEQPPNSVTPPHFHDHEQFQVFVGGSAYMGKQAAHPLSLHYVKGYTPYGPITAGSDGVKYFTLRAGWDSGAKYMPGSRDLLKKERRKHRMSVDVKIPSMDDLNLLAQPKQIDVMAVDKDGMGAYIFAIPEGVRVTLDTPSPAGGQYGIVVAGIAIFDKEELFELSGLFRFRGEPSLEVTGGQGGAAILLMQFSNDAPS
ncbi:MAG: hypothetical protein CMM58_05830 [Rhodospirillaceae bacterium]|nr:hypothetical protein [Rhodospirillaceae bacterium]|tara:strand:- start:345 stop:1106 length:762 start_codon:yes stop_codon:yes gene_type:complete